MGAINKIDEEFDKNQALEEGLMRTLGVDDERSPISLPIHVNGETYQHKGDPIPRSAPSLADQLVATKYPVSENESGRLQLAQWLTDPNHPLTARVLVNRLWHWHFGTGIVRTTDDFGIQGSPPTHPELLDWLAAELISNDWSIKHLHRIIMMSKTYRASSEENSINRAKDPDGIYLSRFPRIQKRRRLTFDAE